MPAVTLEVTRQARVAMALRPLQTLANAIVRDQIPRLAKTRDLSLSLVFVRDAAIRKINQAYRGKDQATDVLSFSFLEKGALRSADHSLGELFISVDTLRRQAKQQKHPQSQELKVLFVHGLLHILGYDHEQRVDLQKMLKQEKKHLGDKAGLIARTLIEPQKGSQRKRRIA